MYLVVSRDLPQSFELSRPARKRKRTMCDDDPIGELMLNYALRIEY